MMDLDNENGDILTKEDKMINISIDIEKYKTIAHNWRRAARSEEFFPWDLKSTIPMEKENAELERQKIREKYQVLQQEIDIATTAEQIKTVIGKFLNF